MRRLPRGAALPTGEPARYHTSDGYVVLRWKIGARRYVEVLEHRVADGRVVDAEHVHHRNHVRDDNTPANLKPTTARDHAVEHGSPFGAAAVALYTAGASLPAVARELGIGVPHVVRLLQVRGVKLRGGTRWDYCARPAPVSDEQLLRWAAAGVTRAAMARQSGWSTGYLAGRLDVLGVPRPGQGVGPKPRRPYTNRTACA